MVPTRLVLLLLAFLVYAHGLASPSPTVTPSRSATPSQTASRSRTPSFTPSGTHTPSVSPTKGGVTPTPSPTRSVATPSPSPTKPAGGATITASPTPSPSGTLSRTPTPSVGGSASGTSSGTSTRTGALFSPSSTASPTSSPTPTVTPTPAATLSQTASSGSSPTSTSSSTFSPTPTASPTATNGGTPSPTASPSTTSTPSPSTSTTATTNVTSEVFTPSPTPSLTTSPTPTSSVTPSVTPTPSVTSTPIACSTDFRTSRTYPCSTPTLNLSTSIYSKNGYPFTTPNLPLTSYPVLSATLSMVFPSLPAPGEALGLKCSTPSEPTLFTLTLPPNPFSSQGRAPFTVPLQISPTSLSPFPASHGVTCTLTSSTSATYPFALNVSTQFASTLSTMPFVSMILAESVSSPGLFRGLAGLPSGPLPPLPLFDTSCSPLSNISTSAATNSSATNSSTFPLMPYNSSQFSSCPAAISSLETYLSGLNATIASPFSTTLSGSTTLLLVASPFSAPFNATSLNVSLGGIPCRINWVSPSGTIMSITSPSLVALCGGNAAAALAGVGDCGVATLLLLTNTTSLKYETTVAAAGGSGGGYLNLPPLPLPAAYPPLQPSLSLSPKSPAYSATTSLAGLSDIPSILDTAASLSSSAQGIRVVATCTDPAYAPPETCSAVVTGWLQPDVPRGKSCAWGGGDNCVPCPVGALCPGGAQMYPLPGYWCPFLNSPPSTLVQCPEPDSTLRCPGYLPDISTSGRSATNATRGRPSTTSYSSVTARCGEGYTGTACAVCAPGFEPGGGNTCVACPSFSSYGAALILPALPFVGGLLLVGCTLLLLFYVSLQVRECRKRTSSRLAGGVGSGGDSTAAGDVEEEEGGGTLAWEGSPIVSTPATAGGAPPSNKGGGSESPSNLYSAVPPVGSVLLWLWLAGQGSASLFTQAQGIAPSYFSPLYGTLSALQFQGLSANPMCFTVSIPFQSFWACVIYLCLCIFAVVGSHACMVTARRRAGRGKLGGCCYSNTKPFAAHINPSTGGVGGGGGGGGKAAGGGGKKRWLCENPPRTLLVLAVTALLVGYGATIGVLMNALTCNLPTPMSLWGYVEAVSDGSTYRKQLGGEGGMGEAALAAAAAGFPTPLPSMAELRAVYNDPYLPANYHLRTLMQSIYFPVSLLATDPYQVCGEGPHRVVWGVALTLLILHSLGLPILGCCVLWYMGHLKGLKGALAKLSARFCSKGKGALSGGYIYSTRWGVVEMYSRGGSKGGKKREGVVPNSSFRWAGEQVDGVAISTSSSPSPSSPSSGSNSSNPSSLPPKLSPTPPPINPNSLFSHLHAALYNDALRRPFFWYPYAEMYVLVVLVGLVALSKRADSVQLFDAAMGGIAAVALSWALFLSRIQPYVKEHAWKKTPAIGLQLLTGLTSVFNALSHRALGASGPSRLALGVVPLVFALLLFIGIVGAWWFSGYEFGNTGWKMAPEETAAVAAAAAALLTPQPPRSPTPSITVFGARVGDGVVVQRNPLAEIASTPAPAAPAAVEKEEEVGNEGESVVEEEAAVAVESSEHLLLQPPPPPSLGPYQRYTDPSDGDVFWFCGASGQSVYVLPEGSSTACGWVDKGGGVWEHSESGVISSTPPSLNVEEMDAYIMANRVPPPQLPPSPPLPPLPPAAVATAVPAETTPALPPLPSVQQQGQQEEEVVVEEGVQQPEPLALLTPPSAPLSLPPPIEDEQHHHKVRSKQESLAAAATALRKTKALRLFRGKGETMTQVEAATLLQVQWRRLRASRSAELWRKIKALEGGKSGKGVGGGGGGVVMSSTPTMG